MNRADEWEQFWQEKAEEGISDHEYDRGNCPRGTEIENLSTEETLEFVAPRSQEVIFDAGCGSGVNLFRLHAKVKRMIGMDYTDGAIERCQKRITDSGIKNVELIRGSVTEIPLADKSVDKILCMSVLQYLDDDNVRIALKEFARIMTNNGVLILHVKNLSSLYLATLRIAKKIKRMIGKKTKLEYVRPFKWYVKELNEAGYDAIDYNSFNIFTLDCLPNKVVTFLQWCELRNRHNALFRSKFIRRHGSDLKIKAQYRGSH